MSSTTSPNPPASSAVAPRSAERPVGTWSLALRLTAWYVGSSFAILLVATISLYLILIGNLRREQDEFLADKVHVIRDMLQKHPDDLSDLQEEAEQTWAPRQFARVYVRVVDGNGKLLAQSPHMEDRLTPDMFPAPAAADADPGEGVTRKDSQGANLRLTSAQADVGEAGEMVATIQVALDTDTARDLISGYRSTLLLVLGGGLATCGFAGYWLARAGLKSLRQIAATAERVSSTNLRERIDVAGLPTELSSLAHQFNDMLGRLEDSFGRLSRFSADIAHEVRTPVNNLRIGIEVALGRARSLEEYHETLGSCLEECNRLSRIIDSMLFIARSEDPRTHIAREPVDVSRELLRLREFFELPAAEAGVELTVDCAPQVHADLDRLLFQRAISNLVGNAIRYTPRGGRVSVAAARANGELRVEVIDTGCGIAPQDLPRIFDRFYRADPARSNTSGNVGLGLAIVKSIVSLHGGAIAARSHVGEGTCMSIRLPAENRTPSPGKPRAPAGDGRGLDASGA
jgi:two-component system, OmpR family, heavy metal sensor histidine kinase CusS